MKMKNENIIPMILVFLVISIGIIFLRIYNSPPESAIIFVLGFIFAVLIPNEIPKPKGRRIR